MTEVKVYTVKQLRDIAENGSKIQTPFIVILEDGNIQLIESFV
jgi:hypothetical protein